MNKSGRPMSVRAALAGLGILALGVAQAAPTQYLFSQTGFQDDGVVLGSFVGEDLNGDGRLSSVDHEIQDFLLSFNGNSIIPGFTHTQADLFALSLDVPGTLLGDGGEPMSELAEGLASNWRPEGEGDLDGVALTGYSFATGLGPLGEVRAEIIDLDTGARLLSPQAMTVQASAVPEPAAWSLMLLGLLVTGAATKRRRALSLVAGAALGVAALGAQAQTAVIWQQGFAGGLGQFSAAGSVSTGADGARLVGSAWSTDGAITTARLSTAGFTNVTLSYDRLCVAGLDSTEGAVAEYAVNGGAFTRLELTRETVSARPVFSLPASAANATLVLRWRISANAATDACSVNNVALSGNVGAVSSTRPAIGKFTTFESGQVRPLALSANGQRLYAVNTPDSRVEVFDVSGTKPLLIESIPVGLEPVALALAPDGRLWVVNHLSDSISIVNVAAKPARVINTLLVGDEPRDIVFAGAGNRWAFITAAHRGQNVKFDPKLTTPGTGRADVWVFDAAAPATNLGGTPKTVLNMFGDTLRGLARNADGTRVYAAVLNSGNKTTVLDDDLANGGLRDKAPPFANVAGVTQPLTGLIVQKNSSGNWVDSGDPKTGTQPKVWNSRVKLNLPDLDVFTIGTGDEPAVVGQVPGVGTTLFNLAVNPRSGKVYVSNQEALNLTRFEGPGTSSTTVRGHFVESRITVIDGATVSPRHLNKHITSYGAAVGTAAEKAAALATPLEMAVTADGSQLYLAAMGSNKLARFRTVQLEGNSFVPSAADQLLLTGGGPTGVVLDEARNRAFVLTRFDNGISVVNTSAWAESAHVKMFNPEPVDVVKGRPFLYDARLTSSRGDSSCAGCHVFADMDHLAWDLGNPDEQVASSPNRYNANVPAGLRRKTFHPMKGPMTTQSLRGMLGQGPMHWRGDRTGATRSAGETLEDQSFQDFNVAFKGLLGREAPLTDDQMATFARYALNLSYPPNPVANLDNSMTADQSSGKSIYTTVVSDTLTTCNGCHAVDAKLNRFGTDGTMSFEGPSVSEDFKIPHLRNMYQKIGMFGRNLASASAPSVGDQIRGFGFDKSGGSGSVFSFLTAEVFSVLSDTQRRQLEQFNLAMPSNLDPVVGQQVTVTSANAAQADIKARLDLLTQRAKVTSPRPECELVAKGVIGLESRGWVMNSSASFVPDRAADTPVTLAALISQVSDAGSAVTFTCVPLGNGTRMGIDRDANSVLDRN